MSRQRVRRRAIKFSSQTTLQRDKFSGLPVQAVYIGTHLSLHECRQRHYEVMKNYKLQRTTPAYGRSKLIVFHLN